ncbi:hypothetical protein OK016_13470 [Vibrio chagasii]|nr:hypothetical protein [Vibrio chagasii]
MLRLMKRQFLNKYDTLALEASYLAHRTSGECKSAKDIQCYLNLVCVMK